MIEENIPVTYTVLRDAIDHKGNVHGTIQFAYSHMLPIGTSDNVIKWSSHAQEGEAPTKIFKEGDELSLWHDWTNLHGKFVKEQTTVVFKPGFIEWCQTHLNDFVICINHYAKSVASNTNPQIDDDFRLVTIFFKDIKDYTLYRLRW
jgi:hypothetical protein